MSAFSSGPLKCLLLCLLMGGGWQQVEAQWYLQVHNLITGSHNVRVFLGHTSLSDKAKPFHVELNFRDPSSNRVFLHKEFDVTVTGSDTVSLDLKLPQGVYGVDADIEDQRLHKFETVALENRFRVHTEDEIFLSDIFLAASPSSSDSAFVHPVLTSTLPFNQEYVHYQMMVYAPGYTSLSIRAVLYQETEDESESPTVAYQSLHQTNRVLNMEFGSTLFQDSVDLTGLRGGEYMIQVLVYVDDDFVLDEKTWFVKGGDIKQRIYEDLDNSIRMMRYVAPVAQLDSLLRNEDPQVKTVEFRRMWNKLYKDEAEAQMEQYFQKIYAANDRYEEIDTPGWLTDRGRIFVKYGEPRERALEVEGISYLRWTYAKWSLSFLFEKRNQVYQLVE